MFYVCLKIIVNGDMKVQATSLCCSNHERIGDEKSTLKREVSVLSIYNFSTVT